MDALNLKIPACETEYTPMISACLEAVTLELARKAMQAEWNCRP